jgi:peptidoglycan/LPS O-acetylase OafA/YrhL
MERETSTFRIFPALKPESESHLHLDCLRIVASAGIVIFHWKQELDIPGVNIHVTDPLWFLGNLVDLFFVISGFIISAVYSDRISSFRDYRDFIVKRIGRLGPLHWITLLFFIILGVTARLLHLPVDNPEKYASNCILPEVVFAHATGLCDVMAYNGPSWSISAEMVCYILFPAILMISCFSKHFFVLAVFTAIGALYLTDIYHPSRPWYDWTSGMGFARALPEFALGMVLFGWRNVLGKIKGASLALFLLIVSIPGAALYGLPRAETICLLYGVVALAVAADVKGKASPIVRRLAPSGQLTYSIYMLHTPLHAIAFGLIANHILHLRGASRNVFVAAAVVLLWFVSYISYVYFETPARKWISRCSGTTRRNRKVLEPADNIAP